MTTVTFEASIRLDDEEVLRAGLSDPAGTLSRTRQLQQAVQNVVGPVGAQVICITQED